MTGTFRGPGTLEETVLRELVPAWESAPAHEVAEAVQQFSVTFSGEFRKQAKVRPTDLEAYREWGRQVASWLYDASHVTLSYTLRYEDVDIRRLSPGMRGIVLLLLYLALDRQETLP